MSDLEFARMSVHPFCPTCGGPAMFTPSLHDPKYRDVDALVPCVCGNPPCDWEGVSRRTVPQPRPAGVYDLAAAASPQPQRGDK